LEVGVIADRIRSDWLRGVRFSRWVVTLGVGSAIVLGSSSAAPSTGATAPALPVAQLVAVARDALRGLSDPNVSTASVVVTTKRAAENWMEPGAVPPGPSNPIAYLIVLRGRFICTSCSFLSARAPRGGSAQAVWVPGQGVSDSGLTRSVPPGLAKLGPVFRLRLIAPASPRANSRSGA
jgi:hypothetical protein